MIAPQLDETVSLVREELARRGAPAPDILMMLGTGMGALPPGHDALWRLPFEVIEPVPAAWRGAQLIASRAGGALVWSIADAPGDDAAGNAVDPSQAAWERAFPCWLAADSGAGLLIHTSAGAALPAEEGALAPGSIALVKDHLNLSFGSPLVGLGESRLGPLFPDTQSLHHSALRIAAGRRAAALAIPCAEAIAACTAGPAIETPAERAYYAKAGAQVSVQGLVDPLLAAAHAGLSCLALVCVIAGPEATSIQDQLVHAEHLAPRLDELLGALAPDTARIAGDLRGERE